MRPTPRRRWSGASLDAEHIARAADLAAEAARPQTDHRGSADYKRHVVHTFVTRILTKITDRADRAA